MSMTGYSRREFVSLLGMGATTLAFRPLRSADATEDILFMSATKLSGLIRDKKVSATEAVKAYIARIEAVNPKLNAVVQFCFERALRVNPNLEQVHAAVEQLRALLIQKRRGTI